MLGSAGRVRWRLPAQRPQLRPLRPLLPCPWLLLRHLRHRCGSPKAVLCQETCDLQTSIINGACGNAQGHSADHMAAVR